jgi:hypothetical protein
MISLAKTQMWTPQELDGFCTQYPRSFVGEPGGHHVHVVHNDGSVTPPGPAVLDPGNVGLQKRPLRLCPMGPPSDWQREPAGRRSSTSLTVAAS